MRSDRDGLSTEKKERRRVKTVGLVKETFGCCMASAYVSHLLFELSAPASSAAGTTFTRPLRNRRAEVWAFVPERSVHGPGLTSTMVLAVDIELHSIFMHRQNRCDY